LHLISTATAIPVGKSELHSEVIKRTDKKLSVLCNNEKRSPQKENIMAFLLEEQDQIVSNLNNSAMLHTLNRSRNPLAHLEAHNEMLEQYQKMYFASNYSTDSLQRRVTETVPMHSRNTPLPEFLHNAPQQCASAAHFSSPHFSNDLKNYFKRKMNSIYAQYPSALHRVSHVGAAFAQNPFAKSSQASVSDCAKSIGITKNKVSLKRAARGSSGLFKTPNSSHAHSA